ncbi:MAG: hypothetical protein JWO38_714 [Gemmataceae bacterium]|nr:hypothetical protein [Gemmataceae bacterium]
MRWGSWRYIVVAAGSTWGGVMLPATVSGAESVALLPVLPAAAPSAVVPPLLSSPLGLSPAQPETLPPVPMAPVPPLRPAQLPAALPPPNTPSVLLPPTRPAVLPPLAPTLDPPVKDLTPPGFAADPYPPAGPGGHAEVPGHLNPAAPAGGGPFVSAELLLFRPRRGAFDFVIPGTAASLATTGPVESLNYQLQPGVRAELGYRFGASGWDALAGYTYFHSAADRTERAGPGEVLFPTLTRPGLTDNVTVAAAVANLEYNLYDVSLGRRFVVDDHLALRAYGGLRFASIRQDFRAYYDGLDARRAVVSAASNFQGFGPVLGAEAVFAGWRGFHLYARASGGLLTGQSDNPLAETNNAGQTTYVNSGYNVRQVVPVASVGVGGGWQYRTVSVRVGYEITQWYNLIQQPRFTDDVAQGAVVTRPANLSLEGLFVQVGLAF